ncbi:unnamed protein product [Echinostoma caproni]|uniref:Uncharacterized protein n=1 Tax=Echinostoma caproni TaxID=27848 RepID=A0A183AP30_9TREM|nr:unnamed protein product [Echinostoma caproni]
MFKQAHSRKVYAQPAESNVYNDMGTQLDQPTTKWFYLLLFYTLLRRAVTTTADIKLTDACGVSDWIQK